MEKANRAIFKIIVVFLIPLATLLFVARGNIGAIIKKPCLGDIPLIIIVVVLLQVIYTFAVGSLLRFGLGIQMQGNAVFGETMDAAFFVLLVVQILVRSCSRRTCCWGVSCLCSASRATARRA